MLPGLTWELPCPLLQIPPSRRNPESNREAVATGDPNLEEPLELGPEITCFLRGSAKNLEKEEEKAPSPKPPVKELHKWVMWKAEACKMPSWWRELMAVPEVEDCGKLAWEIQASFWLPKRASKLHKMENYHQAPPALLCLLRRNFLPPPNSIFAFWDIWEMQWEKTVGVCPSSPVLGRENWPACWREATPVGGECKGAMRRDEVLPLLLRWGGA